MKVLHVINSLNGSGGAEQGLVREIAHFDRAVENLVVRMFEPDDLEPLLESIGTRVIPLGLRAKSSAWTWPEAARRVKRHIRTFGPDVVHTSLFIGNLVGQLAAAGTGVPVLSTLTLTGDERLHKLLQPGAETIQAAALRKIAAFVGRRSHVWYRALTKHAADTNCASMGIQPSRGHGHSPWSRGRARPIRSCQFRHPRRRSACGECGSSCGAEGSTPSYSRLPPDQRSVTKGSSCNCWSRR